MFANNVLAHVPDPNEIAAGIRTLLADDGIAHIEAPYLVRMIELGAFDTIYHEHQCYLSVSALTELFHRHDLKLIGVEVVPIHGGSLHLQVARAGDESQAEEFCRRERELGLFDETYYQHFADRVQSIREGLLNEMQKHDRIGAYGAAAKAVVMLNYFGLDEKSIPWVADVSPHKQNHFIPGTHQPIVAPAKLMEVKPDACIVFPWNITEEITRRNRDYLDAGGRFIVPIPEVRVL